MVSEPLGEGMAPLPLDPPMAIFQGDLKISISFNRHASEMSKTRRRVRPSLVSLCSDTRPGAAHERGPLSVYQVSLYLVSLFHPACV